MDSDFRSDILTEVPDILAGNLLQILPNKRLIGNDQHPPVNNADGQAALRICTDPILRPETPVHAGAIITKIEDIFESIAGAILQQKETVVIRLRRRKTAGNRKTEVARSGQTKDHIDIRFPSKSPQEAWKFGELCSHGISLPTHNFSCLVSDPGAFARGFGYGDMYYRDPELFMRQEVVDRYINDIAYSLGVERDTLNVVAAAKGLIAGSFTIERKNCSTHEYGSEKDDYLIPHPKDIQSFKLEDVHWILVIEKEATFRGLANSSYWNRSLAGRGVIITAKGYPDIQTRQFLHLLSTSHRDIPIFCLVDFDPDGIGIMSTYKYGSVKLRHENHNLTVPSVDWLGVKSADIIPVQEPTTTGLSKLSDRDRRIATRMLDRPVFREVAESEWRRELQVMLVLNYKAEIQILSDGGTGLEKWLDENLTNALINRQA